MKKILSFTLAVALAFTLLLGSAFASSGVTVVAPDTFISWGSAGDLTSLAVPSDAVSDGNKYIIYQVRDWVVTYFRVRFVIDSFSRGDPVEGETLSWTRYTGEWGLGVNAALEPASYEVEYHAAEEYTYSQNFLHLPVKSNFDYYDADGELIISGSGYVNDFEGLMDLTLTDGTVIQVPRRLVGNQFVVVRSASDSNQYKIWNFGTPDTLDGIYEGAEGVSYSNSVGSGLPASDPVVAGYTVPIYDLGWDFEALPYVILFKHSTTSLKYISVYASDVPAEIRVSSDTGSHLYFDGGNSARWMFNDSEFVSINTSLGRGTAPMGNNDGLVSRVACNYDVTWVDGLQSTIYATFSLSGGWQWSDWESSSATLALTSYGDIVYETFDYPLSNPDDESSESPDPEPSPSPGGTPDDSNNGLFAWLKTQWVFLMGRLTGVIDAINALADKLDPFSDQTTPILKNFFNVVFPNRITDTDINNIDIALDRFAGWFDTGYTFADFFDLFNQDYFLNWFTDDTKNALDTVGGAE